MGFERKILLNLLVARENGWYLVIVFFNWQSKNIIEWLKRGQTLIETDMYYFLS